jgi:hypothetical protein
VDEAGVVWHTYGYATGNDAVGWSAGLNLSIVRSNGSVSLVTWHEIQVELNRP